MALVKRVSSLTRWHGIPNPSDLNRFWSVVPNGEGSQASTNAGVSLPTSESRKTGNWIQQKGRKSDGVFAFYAFAYFVGLASNVFLHEALQK